MTRFSRSPIPLSEDDHCFYREQGYLILRKVWSPDQVMQARRALATLRQAWAVGSGLSEVDYEREINQIRDLWRHHPFFREALLSSSLPILAAELLGQPAARLFHDHVINKPLGQSQMVPWHQDYAYWPVDTPNSLSLWLTLDDLDAAAGVLEVIPGSHRLGEFPPMDFMRPEAWPLSRPASEAVVLPVERGDVVVLHALTWHRSRPNTSTAKRRAYISLWLPPQAHYAPAHAPWHPVNENIAVPAGSRLNADWFPTRPSGVVVEEDASILRSTHRHRPPKEDWSMFNASQYVRSLLQTRLTAIGATTSLSELPASLLEDSFREDLAHRLATAQSMPSASALALGLQQWAVQQLAYRHHRGRNVYNDGYRRLIDLLAQ